MTDPKILKRLISQLRAKGKTYAEARTIAIAALQKSGNLKKGSTQATPKGEERGNMTAGERAKDRQSRYDNRKPSDYKYNKKTNRATLKG
jgi:hypothetical protein